MISEKRQIEVFEKSFFQKALENAERARDLDYRNVPLAVERAWEILNEPLSKETTPHIVSVYKDIMSRHVSQVEKREDDRTNPQSHAQHVTIEVTPPPQLDYNELKARAIDALTSLEESRQRKAKRLAAKSTRDNEDAA